MKSMKRCKGFTLVELIVVIAIIGVLAGVLVPNAIAWITRAKLKTCNSEAKTVFNTAVTVLQDYQLEGKAQDLVSGNGDATFSTFGTTNKAVEKIQNKLGANFDNLAWAVTVNVSNYDNKNTNTIKVLSVLLADSTSGVYIGRYPCPATKKYYGGIGNAINDTAIIKPSSSVSDSIMDVD